MAKPTIQCIKAPCPGSSIESSDKLPDNTTLEVSDKKFSVKDITQKQVIITSIAVLFLLGLFFNKQIRSFLNA